MNMNKTKEIIISRRIGANPLELEGIDRVDRFTYLGVTITNKLSLEQHIKALVSYSNKLHFLLIRMQSLGLDKESTTAIFNSFTMAKITYAIPFMWTLLSSKDKHALQAIINKAYRRGIIGQPEQIEDIARERILRLFKKLAKDPDHPLYPLVPVIQEKGRRRGKPVVSYAATCRDQKTFFMYCSLIKNNLT